MVMTPERSSKMFIAMKSAPNMSVATGKDLEHQIQGVKKNKPGLPERTSKWDQDRKTQSRGGKQRPDSRRP